MPAAGMALAPLASLACSALQAHAELDWQAGWLFPPVRAGSRNASFLAAPAADLGNLV